MARVARKMTKSGGTREGNSGKQVWEKVGG